MTVTPRPTDSEAVTMSRSLSGGCAAAAGRSRIEGGRPWPRLPPAVTSAVAGQAYHDSRLGRRGRPPGRGHSGCRLSKFELGHGPWRVGGPGSRPGPPAGRPGPRRAAGAAGLQ